MTREPSRIPSLSTEEGGGVQRRGAVWRGASTKEGGAQRQRRGASTEGAHRGGVQRRGACRGLPTVHTAPRLLSKLSGSTAIFP